MDTLATPLALVAAFFFAVATVCEQKGAMEEPESGTLHPGFLVRLMRKPVWLLGLGADALGYMTQAAALGLGRLVSVQPLLVASVVFALPLGAKITHQHVGRREILGAAAVCSGLVIFRFVATPYGGHDDASAAGWVIGAAIIAGLAVLCILAGIGRSAGVRATLLGLAAGMLLGGIVAALTKATVDRFDQGLEAVLGDWHVYALGGVALTGFLLLQAALQTGALAPAMTSDTVHGGARRCRSRNLRPERADRPEPGGDGRVVARAGADGRGPVRAGPLPRSRQTACTIQTLGSQ